MSTKKIVFWVLFWFGMTAIFNAGVYLFMGPQKALEFLGGYIIEQSLSIDNLFLFIMVFSSFGIKPEHQRRILNYGFTGVIILRLIFVVLGISIVNNFHWVLYVFGFILIVSGTKMLLKHNEHEDYSNSKVLKLLGRIIPITDKLEGEKFFVRKDKLLYATPLFAVLILIEFTDVIFAIDSIPAIFSITTDLFIVYTSNIFAIMGLRNMYFLLGKMHEKFKYVKYGVALILVFTGIKLAALMIDFHISITWSLGIISVILVGSICASIAFAGKSK